METLERNTDGIGESMGVSAKEARRKQEFEGEKLVFGDFWCGRSCRLHAWQANGLTRVAQKSGRRQEELRRR